jgi:hypothetical protein
MMTFIPPRLRKPAVYALAGVLFAAAWLVRGGPLWWVSINAVILTAAVVARVYWLGGKDTDEGARAGSRADERQQLVSVRSRALACNLAMVESFIGLTAAIAVRADWWWRSWSPSSSRATVTCSAWATTALPRRAPRMKPAPSASRAPRSAPEPARQLASSGRPREARGRARRRPTGFPPALRP